jgi:hypothetical protein
MRVFYILEIISDLKKMNRQPSVFASKQWVFLPNVLLSVASGSHGTKSLDQKMSWLDGLRRSEKKDLSN